MPNSFWTKSWPLMGGKLMGGKHQGRVPSVVSGRPTPAPGPREAQQETRPVPLAPETGCEGPAEAARRAGSGSKRFSKAVKGCQALWPPVCR